MKAFIAFFCIEISFLLTINNGDNMFKPKKIYYEKGVENYELGKYLFDKYKDIPKIEIDNHNNIEELRKSDNKDFVKLKQYLIIGVRKTHKYVDNFKSSDFLVPFTSSGCPAFCLYCYLVCNYNKCSYLRVFVNKEEMYNKLIKKSNSSEKELTFEIGSNSDLVIENEVTNNLEWIIEEFGKNGKGYITFPTKFSTIDSLLNLNHNGKTIIRMSVNPEYIIKNIEFGTSNLSNRIEAINKLVDAGYRVGILIAPIILVSNWKLLYKELIEKLNKSLSDKVKKQVFFEFIFMTYSYVHRVINEDAIPNSINLYDKQIMTGRGRGRYMYKSIVKESAKEYLITEFTKYFDSKYILYIV